MSNIVDKNTANDLLAKCRKAVEQVLTDEGFEISKVSAKFGDSFGLNISAIPSVKNEFGLNPNSEHVIDFNRYHNVFKIQPNALGVQFTVGGKAYIFEGLAMSRLKYPIAVSNADGKKVLLTTDDRVITAINAAAIERQNAATTKAPRKPSP